MAKKIEITIQPNTNIKAFPNSNLGMSIAIDGRPICGGAYNEEDALQKIRLYLKELDKIPVTVGDLKKILEHVADEQEIYVADLEGNEIKPCTIKVKPQRELGALFG